MNFLLTFMLSLVKYLILANNCLPYLRGGSTVKEPFNKMQTYFLVQRMMILCQMCAYGILLWLTSFLSQAKILFVYRS